MVQVSKVELGGTPYLNKKIVQDKGVKHVKIATEAKPVDTEFEGKKSVKLECDCTTSVLDPVKVKWQMNDTTRNYMIDKYGGDTAKWIGLEIDIAVKQAGSASPGIYPKECSLEKILG